ncbi:hypothetical protein GTG28_20685 [Vibrio sp. OCN044]|uniref:N-acetylmuramoyl-L-alanine amidase n=1 Tax=Vibrio tetraodonis subsp. pristinus TaxID=2695891 RepID=A0A6L8LZS2_9VIBR|nr:N-acetylmuramoyl-L-alanine amidase [Vibrio tetraodonis]MYM61621.1 hypothetical protein [Vibrio tetraodonis subsp. pristinus]
MKKIAIIVGHSAASGGAANAKNGMTEYLFNDQLAQRIAPKLKNKGHEVLIVYRDCTYTDLPFKVNDTGSDVAVSLHCNAYNAAVSGSEVLYYKYSKTSPRLAELIQKEVVAALDLPDRGLRPVDKSHAGKKGDRGGYLCAKTKMPCVIVEPFFIDNDNDLSTAMNKMDQLSEAIAKGIAEYVD